MTNILPFRRPLYSVSPLAIKIGNDPEAAAHRIDFSRMINDKTMQDAAAKWAAQVGMENALKDDGKEIELVRNLLGSRTGVAIASQEGAGDYLNWRVAYFGSGFGVFAGLTFTSRAMRDFPSHSVTAVSCKSWRDAAVEKRPVLHQVSGIVDGNFNLYQRIAFPILNDRGEMSRVITVSANMMREEV